MRNIFAFLLVSVLLAGLMCPTAHAQHANIRHIAAPYFLPPAVEDSVVGYIKALQQELGQNTRLRCIISTDCDTVNLCFYCTYPDTVGRQIDDLNRYFYIERLQTEIPIELQLDFYFPERIRLSNSSAVRISPLRSSHLAHGLEISVVFYRLGEYKIVPRSR